MTRTRRLATWFGAGLIIVLGAPVAYATGGAPAPAGSAQPCGNAAQDFAGGFRDVQYPEFGLALDPADNQGVFFYRGLPTVQIAVQAGGGQIGWTVDSVAYSSIQVQCADSTRPTRVTGFVVYAPSVPEYVGFGRVA